MNRFLTGIQSSGMPHLGNLLSVILPTVELSRKPSNESFLFIADLHSLTSLADKEQRINSSQAIAAAWLACGLDTNNAYLYRQSRIPEVCELAWYLSCITPFPMLANSHAFKEKAKKLAQVNVGLFTYPILMAADIILYDVDYVPIGKDQKQHIEIARDIASSFNSKYGETFKVPKEQINNHVMTIPGTDGQKMSKSYGNTINIFLPEKALKKQIFSIVTDSLSLEAPKNPDNDNVFNMYSLLATREDTEDMRKKYQTGNYGYGHAKQALYELVLKKYALERNAFNTYMEKPDKIEQRLILGEEKARQVARTVLSRVRKNLGL